MSNYQNKKPPQPHLTQRDFQALFEATDQSMLVEDQDGYIISLNSAASRLWGVGAQELVGKPVTDVLSGGLGTGALGTVRRGSYTRPDQSTIELAIFSTPLTLGDDEAILTMLWAVGAGAPTGAGSRPADPAAFDPQAEKMAALERLSERVSHEFNNHLTSIAGFASLIRADDTLSENAREHSKQVIEAAQRAEALTGELLTFGRRARPESGRFSPARVISAVDPHLRKILGSGITLTTLCEEGVPPIAGSADALAQILLQLASNTREAMEGAADGVMKIELAVDDSGITHLRVSDDGRGWTR